MIVESEKEINSLKAIGRVVAQTLKLMMEQAQPGMTTAELDNIGREFLEKEGAQSAPQRSA